MTHTKVELEEAFEYLEELRESGITNMYGAAPYVAAEFHISNSEAREILGKWMESYRK
jgi:hypothetical protein